MGFGWIEAAAPPRAAPPSAEASTRDAFPDCGVAAHAAPPGERPRRWGQFVHHFPDGGAAGEWFEMPAVIADHGREGSAGSRFFRTIPRGAVCGRSVPKNMMAPPQFSQKHIGGWMRGGCGVRVGERIGRSGCVELGVADANRRHGRAGNAKPQLGESPVTRRAGAWRCRTQGLATLRFDWAWRMQTAATVQRPSSLRVGMTLP